MAPKFSPAYEHIRRMEERIQQQRELIAGLRAQGEDSTAATTRLALMARALEEMQFQLGSLSPSDQDTERPKNAQTHPASAGKK
jgi:hypothetical protein